MTAALQAYLDCIDELCFTRLLTDEEREDRITERMDVLWELLSEAEQESTRQETWRAFPDEMRAYG